MRWLLLVLIALGFGLPVRATDPANRQDAAPSPPGASFVAAAAAGDLFEIKSGKLALARSKSETVRALANRMVADHMAASVRPKERSSTSGTRPRSTRLTSTPSTRCIWTRSTFSRPMPRAPTTRR